MSDLFAWCVFGAGCVLHWSTWRNYTAAEKLLADSQQVNERTRQLQAELKRTFDA